MPDYVDVTRLNVRADRPATISAPGLITVYEGQQTSFDLMLNTGSPAATSLTIVLRSNTGPVSEGGSNPDLDYTISLPSTRNVSQSVRVSVTAPTLAGDSPHYRDWFVWSEITNDSGTRRAITVIRVYQSIAATIDIAASHSAYEETAFSADFTYYNGSPGATEIRHSFHESLSDAINDRNARTSGRPGVTIAPTPSQLSGFAQTAPRTRTGRLTYQSDLPAVSNDTDWFARLEIVQDGSVVDSTVYHLSILNREDPSITVVSVYGIEGSEQETTFAYISGAPPSDRLSHVGFYESQSDAQANRNRLTSDDGIPSNVVFDPTGPSPLTGTQHGTLTMTLPYVDADKRIWGLVRIERDRDGGGTDFWQAAYQIDILNRVPATIDVQEVTTMEEQETLMIMGEYTLGMPIARGYGVSIHDSQADAENDRNPVMASDDPRISLSDFDDSGNHRATKQFSIEIVSPDVSADTTWWPRYFMEQDEITPDP